jgi:hypothetical protein
VAVARASDRGRRSGLVALTVVAASIALPLTWPPAATAAPAPDASIQTLEAPARILQFNLCAEVRGAGLDRPSAQGGVDAQDLPDLGAVRQGQRVGQDLARRVRERQQQAEQVRAGIMPVVDPWLDAGILVVIGGGLSSRPDDDALDPLYDYDGGTGRFREVDETDVVHFSPPSAGTS